MTKDELIQKIDARAVQIDGDEGMDEAAKVKATAVLERFRDDVSHANKDRLAQLITTWQSVYETPRKRAQPAPAQEPAEEPDELEIARAALLAEVELIREKALLDEEPRRTGDDKSLDVQARMEFNTLKRVRGELKNLMQEIENAPTWEVLHKCAEMVNAYYPPEPWWSNIPLIGKRIYGVVYGV